MHSLELASSSFLYTCLPFSLCASAFGRMVCVCNQLCWLSLCVYLTVSILVHVSFCFSVTRYFHVALSVSDSVYFCVVGCMLVHDPMDLTRTCFLKDPLDSFVRSLRCLELPAYFLAYWPPWYLGVCWYLGVHNCLRMMSRESIKHCTCCVFINKIVVYVYW